MGPIGSKVIEVKCQIYGGGGSVGHALFSFSVCSPTSPRSLGRSSPNLRILAPGIHLLKVKVIEVKGQISISQQSLVRFTKNLVSVYRLIPD